MKISSLLAAKAGSKATKLAIVAIAVTGGVSLVSSGVFASLTATANNTSAQSIQGGQLTIQLANNGNGITGGVSGVAIKKVVPGDVQYRYINLLQDQSTNNGVAADPSSLTLNVANSSTDTNSAMNDTLLIGVDECVGGTWNAGTNVCSSSNVVSALSDSTINALGTDNSITLSDVGVNQTSHLRVKFSVPSSYSETSLNGVVQGRASDGKTLQSKEALLTFTFKEAQKTGTTTNS